MVFGSSLAVLLSDGGAAHAHEYQEEFKRIGSRTDRAARRRAQERQCSAAAEAGINGGTTHGLLSGIKQNVTSRVDEQKNRAAEGLGGIANVFLTAGNELRSENEAVAGYVDMASDQLRRFADQIRQKGVTDMLDDVKDSRADGRRSSSVARSWSASGSPDFSRARRNARHSASARAASAASTR